MYKISLIIYLSDSENNIMDLFNSLLNQSMDFNELEVIFIYKNAEKKISAIVKPLLKWYNNVSEYTIDENNKWVAYNTGLKHATADYILFINQDTLSFDYTLKTLYELVSDNEIACGNYILEKDNDYISNDLNTSFDNGYAVLQENSEKLNLLDVNLPVEYILFKKDFLLEQGFIFEEDTYSNWIFLIKVFSEVNTINLINKPLFKLNFTDNYIIDYIQNKETFLELFTSFENILKEFNDLDYTFVSNHISYLINHLIYSKIPNEDKLDLMILLNNIFQKFNILNIDTILLKEKLLFELIKSKKYFEAINNINFLNQSNDYFIEKIKTKEIICLFFGFEYDIGGLAKAVFNRVNLLSKKGHKVSLINVDPYTENFLGPYFVNIKYIENNFRKLNYLDSEVKFYNVIDYFHDKYSQSIKNVSSNLNSIFISDDYVKQEVENNYGIRVFNCYSLDEFDEEEISSLKSFVKKATLSTVEDFRDIFGYKHTSKREYYIDNLLYLESLYDENDNICEENLYSDDGFKFLNISKEKGIRYILFDKYSKSQISFNTLESFWDYFVEKICLESNDKVFLINDCSGKIPSFTNISSNLVYKIANIHSNPYLEPTYDNRSPMRNIVALEKVEDLNAIVTLTPSEKEDFIEDFSLDNIFTVPNLINLDEVKEYDLKTFEKNITKISIFARIAKEKNLVDAIKAFKIVIEKHPHAILNIYGRALTENEKKEYIKLKNLVKELNLEKNIYFKGHVDNSYEEMRTSLCTLLVSHIEGLPMVLIESMANKTPVISYDINYGPRDVINNDIDGYVIEKYNIDLLASKIIYLLDHPDRAIKMGQEAQKSIYEYFDTEKIYESWLNVFKNAYIHSKLFENALLIDKNIIRSKLQESENKINKQDQKIKYNEELMNYNSNLMDSLKMNLNYQKEIISKQQEILSEKVNNIENNNKKISEINNKQKLQNKILLEKNNLLNFFIRNSDD